MKAILYAFVGIVLYAIQNTILDVRLKQHQTAELLIGWYVMMLPLGLGLFLYQKYYGGGAHLLRGDALLWIAATAVMFFIADFFYLGAYTQQGGNVVTITTIAVLMPIVAAAVKFGWVGERPTWYHMMAFSCAGAALFFLSLGNSKKPIEIRTSTNTEAAARK